MSKYVRRHDGTVWRLGETTLSSDGFRFANGTMVDPETHEDVIDDDGFPVMHGFFLGCGIEKIIRS
jgi:hypothetical protein